MSDATETSCLDGKVFVLGVGAQRAGTSWLYSYLASDPCVRMSEIKEIHYFNAVWNESHRIHAYNQFTSALTRVASGIDREGSRLPPEVTTQRMRALRDRVAMFAGGDQAYVDYFRGRVSPHHTHFGEITPAYSLLPAEAFQHIRSLFSNIKVIFLMRDPLRRVQSALRLRSASNEAFLAALTDPATVDRTRYDVTITNLRAALPAGSIFFGFYETLFCDASIRSLCHFLGLTFRPGAYERYVNARTEQHVPLTSNQIRVGMLTFAETYAFCRREFGSAVPASWHN